MTHTKPLGGQASPSMLEAALAYVVKGKKVFPCAPVDGFMGETRNGEPIKAKRPLTPHGFKDATADHARIRLWWTKWPDAAIGVPTGPGMALVVDVDLPDGPTTLAALEAKHGPLPPTLEQRTGGGGRQLFYAWPDDGGPEIRNDAGKKLGKGIDIRAAGGYSIVPPSNHPSGGRYAWVNKHPLAEAPAWLLELARGNGRASGQSVIVNAQPLPEGGSAYGLKALEAEAGKVAMATKGERNAAVNRAAFALGQLAAGGELSREHAEAILMQASARCGLIADPEDGSASVRSTIASGLKAGMQEPRTAPHERQEATKAKPVEASPLNLPLRTASSIEVEPVPWIWPGWLAKGCIHVLDGDPGLGKSTLTTWLASIISQGGYWPNGDKAEAGDVLMVNLEDSPSHTIQPRLVASGANLSRVHIFDDAEDIFSLPGSLEALERAIIERGVTFVVIDPLMAALSGEVNGHKDQDIRRVLGYIKAIAQRAGAAFLLVRHMNKAAGASALYRGGGSIGIIAASRVGFLLARHPEDDTKRCLAIQKNNLAPFHRSQSLVFCIEGEGNAARPLFDPLPAQYSADDLLAAEQEGRKGRGRPAEESEECKHWLRQLLRAEAMPAKAVEQQARAMGFSASTLKRARSALQVQAEKAGFDRGWKLRLPAEEDHKSTASGNMTPFADDPFASPVESFANQPVAEDNQKSGMRSEGDHKSLFGVTRASIGALSKGANSARAVEKLADGGLAL